MNCNQMKLKMVKKIAKNGEKWAKIGVKIIGKKTVYSSYINVWRKHESLQRFGASYKSLTDFGGLEIGSQPKDLKTHLQKSAVAKRFMTVFLGVFWPFYTDISFN